MSELKSCPFCGGEARLYGNSKLIGTRLKHYQVAVCANDDCGCRTSPCETVEDAIYKWNRRTPMANIVEKLEEELKLTREAQTIECIGNNGNGTPLQSKFSGEICALIKAINIVKQEINNGLE